MRIRIFIYTLAHQRIINICHRYDLCRNWNLFSGQTIRITFTIITLMMPSADLVRDLDHLLILIMLQLIQHRSTNQRMLFHSLKFFFSQLSRLIQNRLVNSNLTDIMKRGCCRNQIAVIRRQIICIRILNKSFQKKSRQCIDVDNMKTALSITKFHNLTQDFHHHLIVLFLFMHLIGYHGNQPSLFCIQLDRIKYTLVYNLAVKRSADIIGYSKLERFPDIVLRFLAGYHNYRHIFNPVIPVHIHQNFKAVHNRHHDVEQYQ